MSDINEWRLDYDGSSLTFGTLDSAYPLSVQAEIGEPAWVTQDGPHPSSDGTIMGTDSLGGFTITFTMTTLPVFRSPDAVEAEPAWRTALDIFSRFKSMWRANSVRRTPGKYATLSNIDRKRMVYGRPRRIGQINGKLRRGIVGLVATFDTIDPNWVSTTEKVSSIRPVVSSTSGFTAPFIAPIVTTLPTQTVRPLANEGDMPAWAQLDFYGPSNATSFGLLSPDGRTLWAIEINDPIRADEVLTVDTRPWSRGATVNGRPANGMVTGTALEDCTIAVGEFSYRYRSVDPTGTSKVIIRWRDTTASE